MGTFHSALLLPLFLALGSFAGRANRWASGPQGATAAEQWRRVRKEITDLASGTLDCRVQMKLGTRTRSAHVRASWSGERVQLKLFGPGAPLFDAVGKDVLDGGLGRSEHIIAQGRNPADATFSPSFSFEKVLTILQDPLGPQFYAMGDPEREETAVRYQAFFFRPQSGAEQVRYECLVSKHDSLPRTLRVSQKGGELTVHYTLGPAAFLRTHRERARKSRQGSGGVGLAFERSQFARAYSKFFEAVPK